MIDDHRPFLDVGIPAVDIIDFDYPYWHTLADTPDKCSPASLEAVGRVVESFVEQQLMLPTPFTPTVPLFWSFWEILSFGVVVVMAVGLVILFIRWRINQKEIK
jgi:hypothetical protein